MYAQVIDDAAGTTLVASSSKGMAGGMLPAAKQVGADIAKRAQAQGIATVVFDRGGFSYTGTIKALADGAREGGLSF